VLDGMPLFEVAVAGEIFGMPRPDLLSRPYLVQVCRVGEGPVRSEGARMLIGTDAGLDEIRAADTVLMPALPSFDTPVPDALVAALQAAAGRGARVAALCTGAFALAAAGLLDGRRATTHWDALDELRAISPAIAVTGDERFVDEGAVVTAAGVSAGIDMGLTLAATIADEHTAKALQLLLAYDPQPPFDCGAVNMAPAEIVTTMRALREFIVDGAPEA
jgi:AraC family transcriptional regulator, transcriptional activator FtrA